MSHAAHYIRGVMYCQACGAFSASARMRNLSTLCPLKPKNASAAFVLKRIAMGKHPVHEKDFPLMPVPKPPWL